MENVKVIGLTGRAGSGKDLVGAMLHLYNFERMAFGDELKREVAYFLLTGGRDPLPAPITQDRAQITDMLPLWTVDRVFEKPTGRLMRSLLQQWGTEFRRAQDPNHWIGLLQINLARRIREHGTDRVVITDVRFPNEAQWIRDNGGEVWLIERPSVAQDSHVSEQPLPSSLINRTICNDLDVQILAQRVKIACENGDLMR